MKKYVLVALTLLVGASFNTVAAQKKNKKKVQKSVEPVVCCTPQMKTAADTLSYAAGVVRTEGLIPYLQKSLDVDTAYMAEFIEGYKHAFSKGVTAKDKAFYAGEQVAMMVAQRMVPFLKEEFKSRPDSISQEMFNVGFINTLSGNECCMKEQTAKEYFNKAFKQVTDERNEANRKAGEEYLAANKNKEGVVTLASGLQYKELVKGTGEVPQAGAEVTVKYEGRLIDGTVFDSSYNRGGAGTSKFRTNQVIKGWTEALQMMPVGSKWELYIPQNLAYGDRKAGKIAPYSALVFTVELVAVEQPKKSGDAQATPVPPMKKGNTKAAPKKSKK